MKTKVLKPFDIDKAKAGAEVSDENGHPVRIICYDAMGDWPIIALKTCGGGVEIVEKYNSETASQHMRIVESIEEPLWRYQTHAGINGYFANSLSHAQYCVGQNTSNDYRIFATEKQVLASIAAARISQIIANDPRFGGTIKDEEWDGKTYKYCLERKNGEIVLSIYINYYSFIAFHTREQAELFLKENRDLIEQFYML